MPTFPEYPPKKWRDDDPNVQRIRACLPRFVEQNPFRRYGATAVGLGPRIRGGRYKSEPCLRVYVGCKRSTGRLPPKLCVPSKLDLATGTGETTRVPTDVIEMSAPRPVNGHKDKHRPVPGGVSVKVMDTGNSGTLGGWVLDRTDDTVVALSNLHVSGKTAGSACIQPVSVGGGFDPANRIGSVKRGVPLKVMPENPTMADCNLVDAAILSADDPDLIDLTVLELVPAIYDTGMVTLFTPVIKSGWITGVTSGTIVDTDLHWPMTVDIVPGVERTYLMCWGLVFQGDPGTALPGVVDDGDSGSILYIREERAPAFPKATGLVYGKADGNGVACRIQDVFAALNLDVLCASGYPAYLDELAADEAEPSGPRFTLAERARVGARLATSGLARSVDRRLQSGVPGRKLSELIRKYRHPIFQGLVHQGDLRRAATRALMPVLVGARTSDDVLDHVMTVEDARNIDKLVKVLRREGLPDLAKRLAALPLAKRSAVGKCVRKLMKLSDDA